MFNKMSPKKSSSSSRTMNVSFSLLSVLILTSSIVLKSCQSSPLIKSHKELDPVPLFLWRSLPLEIDEPKSTIVEEDLPGKERFSSEVVDRHHDKEKKSGIFSDNDKNSCCPTKVEVIEPLGGKNREGSLVQLYQSAPQIRQRFYEISCSPKIADQPCRYLDKEHQPHSRCVQQYSYTYALVRDYGVDYEAVEGGGWRLDYIQVRSGCGCRIGGDNNGGSEWKRDQHRY